MIESIRREIEPCFDDINACHDIMHTDRVLKTALHIAKIEGADLQIVELASLLHDIARKLQDESQGKICHAKEGAKMARIILSRHNLPKEVINRVVYCVASHRLTGGIVPETLEAKILFDADKLDAMGAIGLGRAFSFAGYMGAYVHDPDLNLETAKDYSKDDSPYREFLVRSAGTGYKMFTNEGQRIAEGRLAFMKEFFDRINLEVKGEL
jgi:uncharacterized protein